MVQGNYTSAGVSVLGVIPFAAVLTTGVKAVKAAQAVRAAEEVIVAGKEVATIAEGIYQFTHATSGKIYVGQSKNLAKRLRWHIAKGNLKAGETVTVTEVLGGKTQREIAEQLRIDALGGVDFLENVRNPIGKAREYLLPKPR